MEYSPVPVFKSLAIIFILSVLAKVLWLHEIVVVIGWPGLNWLSAPLYSPYQIVFVSALSYLTGWFFSSKNIADNWQRVTAILLFYFINLLFYFIGKNFCYSLFCRFCFWGPWYIPALILLVIFILFGLIYWGATNRLMLPIGKKFIFFIAALSLLVIPLSLATFYIVPGIGGPGDWLDGIKMGYPVFWITFLLGVCGILIAGKKNATTN